MTLATSVALALVAVCGPTNASGQTVAPAPARLPAAPQFPIESIAVEGTSRESVRRIVRQESRLDEGGVYDEEAIALAVRRVKRLPFLLDARPTLRRGSLPGRYQLVIEVQEIAVVVASGHGTFGGGFGSGAVSLGANHFLGASTQVSASATVTDATFIEQGHHVQLGFSRYGLFGDASRLNVDGFFASGEGFEDYGITSVLRLPAGRNHSFGILASVGRRTTQLGAFPPLEGPEETSELSSGHLSARADWVFDTTDDPFAAREGMRASANLSAQFFRSRGSDLRDTARQASAELAGTKPLSGMLSAAGDMFIGCNDYFESTCGARAGAALRLVKAGRRNRYRAFVEAGVSVFRRLDETDPRFPNRNLVDLELSAGLRTRFAVLSLSFFPDLE